MNVVLIEKVLINAALVSSGSLFMSFPDKGLLDRDAHSFLVFLARKDINLF